MLFLTQNQFLSIRTSSLNWSITNPMRFDIFSTEVGSWCLSGQFYISSAHFFKGRNRTHLFIRHVFDDLSTTLLKSLDICIRNDNTRWIESIPYHLKEQFDYILDDCVISSPADWELFSSVGSDVQWEITNQIASYMSMLTIWLTLWTCQSSCWIFFHVSPSLPSRRRKRRDRYDFANSSSM